MFGSDHSRHRLHRRVRPQLLDLAEQLLAFRPQSDCIGAIAASDSPDGNITEKGAQDRAAQHDHAQRQDCTAFSCRWPRELQRHQPDGSNAGANISTNATSGSGSSTTSAAWM